MNIEELIKTNAKKKSKFCYWYVNSTKKDKKDYDLNCKKLTSVEYETAIQEWLLLEDVQNAIKELLKQQRNIKMLEIYNSMYEKALKGDVKASEWVEKFFKSDFFDNKQDEVDNFLDGIDIPALKGE